MTHLVITRHGYSEYNKTRMYTGQVDVALTELGLRQAEKTAEYVAENYKIDAIYSSDLRRAMSTAIPLSERLGISVIKEPLIKEIYGGLWENKLMPEIDEKYHDDYQVYKTTIGLARCTGGESMAELQARALEGMRNIAEANDGKTVFVATHGGVLFGQGCAQRGNGTVKAILVQGDGVHIAFHEDEIAQLALFRQVQAKEVFPLIENKGLRGV